MTNTNGHYGINRTYGICDKGHISYTQSYPQGAGVYDWSWVGQPRQGSLCMVMGWGVQAGAPKTGHEQGYGWGSLRLVISYPQDPGKMWCTSHTTRRVGA